MGISVLVHPFSSSTQKVRTETLASSNIPRFLWLLVASIT